MEEERFGKEYQEEFGALDYMPWRPIGWFWKYLVPPMRILVVGAPLPKHIGVFVERGDDVYFIDISDYAVKKSISSIVQRYGSLPKNIHILKGDIRKTEFPDKFFDLVICRYILEHYGPEENMKILREIYRITKKYAVIGVTTLDVKPDHLEADPTHVTKWTFNQWKSFIESSGLFRILAKKKSSEIFFLEKIDTEKTLGKWLK